MGFSPAGNSVSGASDVALSNPGDAQVLAFSSLTQKWSNATPATVITDHGGLTGLGDDTHTQYHTDARGDARYYTQAQVTSQLAAKANTSSLATVATSGSYADLSGKPAIPKITASTSAPSNPAVGDMWVDLSA